MDEQLQAKIDEAKAAGYSDEEIQHYLSTKELPVEQPLNRSDEALGTMQAALPQAAIYAGEGALLGYGIKAVKDAFGNRTQPGPVAPAMPAQTAAAPAMAVNSKPNLSVQTGGAAPTQMSQPITKAPVQPVAPTGAQTFVQKLALDKLIKGAGIVGAGYELGKGLLYTSPEERAILQEDERRRRAQGWKPLNER